MAEKPDPLVSERYEAELRRLHGEVAAVMAAHRCDFGPCGWTDMCDALGDAIGVVIDAAFRPADAEEWLSACPAAWEWSTESEWETTREYVIDAFRTDAWQRILPRHAVHVVDPATTIQLSYGP